MGKLIKKLKKRAAAREKIPVRVTFKTICPECGKMMEVKNTVPHMVAGYCENCNKPFFGRVEKIPESMRRKMQRQLKTVPGSAGGKCTNKIIKWINMDGREDNAEA